MLGRNISVFSVWWCFNSMNYIWRQMNNHFWNIPYIFSLCGKEFISRNNFKKSIQIHTVENPYHYDLCGKALISCNYLKSDAWDNTCPCSLCDQELISRNYLKRHIRININVLCGGRSSAQSSICRDTWKVILLIINIDVSCVSSNTSPSATKRDT